MLYEVTSGTRAFPGTDALNVAHAVIHKEPPPPSQVRQPGARVPAGLDAVILRGLSKEPRARYEHVLSLVHALRTAYFESGLIARAGLMDTLPAVTVGERPTRPGGISADAPKKSLRLWPFGLALLAGLAVVFKLVPATPAASVDEVEVKNTVPDTNPGPLALAPASPDNAAAEVARTHDGAAEVADAATKAASAEIRDAAQAPPEVLQLSPFEREERAKDALDRAERALREGRREQAKAALDEAFLYDPEHPDIAALRAKL